mgnify:CR=1 FL=1
MISERIKMIRKKLNLTQTEFGNRIGLKQNTIATYEANDRGYLLGTAEQMAREANNAKKDDR